jgi:glycosyltransferase involved in cell wall biosynthesis
MPLIPVSAIIATRNRPEHCANLLRDLAQQSHELAEVLICDGSDTDATRHLIQPPHRYLRATTRGAAPQRNQAIQAATQPYLLLLDDDIRLQPDCLHHLWDLMATHPSAGGVTGTIINEAYRPPGPWTRRLLRWFEHGHQRPSYAGTCIGPGLTFWPADDPSLPPAVAVDWMGAGLALYRRDLLPQPPFPPLFEGASLGEDLALSLTVAKHAPLWQATRARYTHLNVGGDHKSDPRELARMSLINRHHILTQVLGKQDPLDYLQFAIMIAWGWLGTLRQGHLLTATQQLIGYLQATLKICVK